jgi:hypothetical protein
LGAEDPIGLAVSRQRIIDQARAFNHKAAFGLPVFAIRQRSQVFHFVVLEAGNHWNRKGADRKSAP